MDKIEQCRYGDGLSVRRLSGVRIRRTRPPKPHAFYERLILDDALRLISNLQSSRQIGTDALHALKIASLASRYGYDEPHRHEQPELLVLLDGSCRVAVKHRVFRLVAPHVLPLQANWLHTDTFESPDCRYDLLSVIFLEDHVLIHLNRYCPSRHGAEYVRSEGVWFDLPGMAMHERALFGAGRDVQRFRAACLAWASESVAQLRKRGLRPKHPAVQRCVAWMEQNPSQEVSVSGCARDLGMTPNYLSALFAREMGVTATEYLKRLRFERVRQLMQDPRKSLKQIAAACGFSDPLYFSRVFRQTYGMPPSEYRRRVFAASV